VSGRIYHDMKYPPWGDRAAKRATNGRAGGYHKGLRKHKKHTTHITQPKKHIKKGKHEYTKKKKVKKEIVEASSRNDALLVVIK